MKSLGAVLVLVSGCFAIAADKPLAIVHPVFARSEDGAPEASDEDFVSGETVHFSCQAEGYKKKDKPNDYGKQDVRSEERRVGKECVP